MRPRPRLRLPEGIHGAPKLLKPSRTGFPVPAPVGQEDSAAVGKLERCSGTCRPEEARGAGRPVPPEPPRAAWPLWRLHGGVRSFDPSDMPLLNVYTSSDALPDDRANALLKQLSASVAEHLRKPEQYVMTCLVPQTRMTFAGTDAPACFVEVKSMGTVAASAAKALSGDVSKRLSAALGIPASRIFIVFSEVAGHLWGHDGSTFG